MSDSLMPRPLLLCLKSEKIVCYSVPDNTLGMEHWKAKELACSRKGYWRMAKVLNQIFSKKIIARLGYLSMLDYYLVVCEN